MEPEIIDALVDLKKSVDRQIETQERANGLLSDLISTLEMSNQVTENLTKQMSDDG